MANDFILDYNAPMNLDPMDTNSEINMMGERFEFLCGELEELSVPNPADMPVYSLYKRIERLEKKHKKN